MKSFQNKDPLFDLISSISSKERENKTPVIPFSRPTPGKKLGFHKARTLQNCERIDKNSADNNNDTENTSDTNLVGNTQNNLHRSFSITDSSEHVDHNSERRGTPQMQGFKLTPPVFEVDRVELVESLKRNVQHLTKTIASIRSQEIVLRKELKEKDAENQLLEDKYNELEEIFNEYKAQNMRAGRKCSSPTPPKARETRPTTPKVEVKFPAEQVTNVWSEKEKRFSDLKASNKRLIEELSRVSAAAAKAQSGLETYKQQVQSLMTVRDSLEAQVSQLQHDAHLQSLPIRALELDKVMLAKQIEDLKKKLAAEKEEVNKMACKLIEERSEWNKQLKVLENNLVGSTQQVHKLVIENEQLKAKSDQARLLASSIAVLENEKQKVELQLKLNAQEIFSLKESSKAYKEKCGRLETETEGMLMRVQATEKELESTKKHCFEFQCNLEAREQMLAASENTGAQLREHLHEMERKLSAQRRGSSKYQELLEEKEKQLEEIQSTRLKVVSPTPNNLRIDEEVKQLQLAKSELLSAIDKLVQTEDASENLYSCSKCLEIAKTPITLVPCGHNYCEDCISTIPTEPDLLVCQICGEDTTIVTKVKNIALQSLISKFTYRMIAIKSVRAMAENLRIASSQRHSQNPAEDETFLDVTQRPNSSSNSRPLTPNKTKSASSLQLQLKIPSLVNFDTESDTLTKSRSTNHAVENSC